MMTLRAGDWIEVRSKEEILASLDANGRLDDMPFMPEMLAFCGKRYRVRRSAHKACDTIHPVAVRSLSDSVFLDQMRCSGAAHGDCQASCAIFWKHAWLKPVDGPMKTPLETRAEAAAAPQTAGRGCTEEQLQAATQDGVNERGAIKYRCQTTDLPRFTKPMQNRILRQFVDDFTTRNESLGSVLLTTVYYFYDKLFQPDRKDREAFRWFYDRVQAVWGGMPYPLRSWLQEDRGAQPQVDLDLQPGELVRIKSYEEILATLNSKSRNRGLLFGEEMVPYCGGVFRVRSRVDHFLDEPTGVMKQMKTPAVILEGVICRSRVSRGRFMCPRAIYAWWREAWLERAPEGATVSLDNCLGAKAYLKDEAVREAEA